MYYKTEKSEDGEYTTIKSESPIDGGGSGSSTLYAWRNDRGYIGYFDFDISPADGTELGTKHQLDLVWDSQTGEPTGEVKITNLESSGFYVRSSDTAWGISEREYAIMWTREISSDVTLWNAEPVPHSTTLYAYQEWEDNDWGYYVLYTTKENVEVGDYLTEINEGGHSSRNEITAIDSETGIVTTSHDYKHNPELDIVFD